LIISFDERDAARAGISNLTGETVRTQSDPRGRGSRVTQSTRRSWVRPDTVPLSFWCLFCVVTTEQREARRFTASPLGCLVQFTHSGNSDWDRW